MSSVWRTGGSPASSRVRRTHSLNSAPSAEENQCACMTSDDSRLTPSSRLPTARTNAVKSPAASTSGRYRDGSRSTIRVALGIWLFGYQRDTGESETFTRRHRICARVVYQCFRQPVGLLDEPTDDQGRHVGDGWQRFSGLEACQRLRRASGQRQHAQQLAKGYRSTLD